jgi:hypothetical protein
MSMRPITPLVFSILLCLSSCFPQHRLDFDLDMAALRSCDGVIKIRNVTIWEKGESNWIKISKSGSFDGSSIIYLDKENPGYDCTTNYPIKFKPSREYVVSSYAGDSGIEMSFFTDSNGKIDSVSNPFSCK